MHIGEGVATLVLAKVFEVAPLEASQVLFAGNTLVLGEQLLRKLQAAFAPGLIVAVVARERNDDFIATRNSSPDVNTCAKSIDA